MTATKKHYRIVSVNGSEPEKKMDTYNTTPSGAAKKIFSLLKKHGVQQRQKKTIEVSVKDVSRNSSTKGKVLSYRVQKTLIDSPKPIKRGKTSITFTYKTTATRI